MVGIVVVATIVEGHDVRQQIVVGEDNLYGLWFADGGSCPTPNLATDGCSAYEFTEVTALTALQVGSAVSSAYLTIDGRVPTEAGQFEIGAVSAIYQGHAVWCIGRACVVWLLKIMLRLGLGIREYGESQLGAAVRDEFDILRLIAQ